MAKEIAIKERDSISKKQKAARLKEGLAKAEAARTHAAELARTKARYKDTIKDAVSQGFRFVTVKDTTICYKVLGKDTVLISTSIKNPKDRFDKLQGQLIAKDNMDNGHSVIIRSPKAFSLDKDGFLWPVGIKFHLAQMFNY